MIDVSHDLPRRESALYPGSDPKMTDTLSRLRAGELAGQTRLDLRCGLEEFPEEIFQLSETLEILNLSGNRLSRLPDDLHRLAKLKILFCSDNDFEVMPEAVGRCPSLEMVGFKSNRIADISETAFPPKLRWLILTDNRIERLPGSIGKCGRLQKLMLAGNRLGCLPDEMRHCANLELIRLSANRFEELPGWLFDLPRLAWLGLGGNPWASGSGQSTLPEISWNSLEPGDVLGEGASGIIRRATYVSGTETTPVAVKLFKGAMTSDGTPETEMAVSIAAGNHPNLTGLLGRLAGHPEGRHGLVMPRLDSGYENLAAPPDFETCTRDVYPDGTSFTPQEVLEIAGHLASAGRHLHARRIMHGDFYAHNILRHGDGHCILGDFGAACVYPESEPLEKIEVRAFGLLLEELLARTSDSADSTIVHGLEKIQRQCVAEKVMARPEFSRIQTMLADLESPSGS